MTTHSLSITDWRHAIDCAIATVESDERFYALLYILSEVKSVEPFLGTEAVTLPEKQQRIIFG